MKALSYRAPLDRKGRFAPWFKPLRKLSGVYVIRSEWTGRVVYVGESHTGRLAKTIKRHFYSWQDDYTKGPHNTYNPAHVTIAARPTPANRASAAQNRLILRLNPRDNGPAPAREDNEPY